VKPRWHFDRSDETELRALLAGDALLLADGGDGGGSGSDDAPGGDGGQPPAGGDGDPGGSGADDPAALKAKLDKAVEAERAARKRAQAAEAKAKQLEDAGLSEKEKAERERDEAKTQLSELTSRLRSYRAQAIASRAGIRPDASDVAASLLDWNELGDDASDAQLEAALKAIASSRPYLRAGTDIDAGARGNGGSRAQGDMNSILRTAAGRT
jgi:hypothetical protein